ncbi:U3 small nucleolar ribonucleo MPP10 isoform X1 [Olea europaea subsp. europaea]|uniref:U3 small nucleolar ribonucleoprotein protein MPP10 n=1 Tax=Olea europaea subsp. europaea TaxID=158383 RepID=A0A8S0UR66_OLEEU|nr:U3 small nucleolar ribonucleo MPP10 isoform X1 [Olea europaea subsp. europaea]
MASTADSGAKLAGLDSLHRLKSTEPPFFLSPSPDLSQAARIASRYLYSSLKPFAPKSPFSHLLTEGFDAEQIWQQIDLQSQPLLLSLRRHVKHFEKNPEEIEKQFDLGRESFRENRKEETEDGNGDGDGDGDGDEDDKLVSGEGEEIDDLESENEGFDEDEEEEDGGDDDNDVEMEDEDMGNENGVEDKFLKIKELEEYLVDDEEKEYGLKKEKRKRRKIREITNEDEDDEEDDEDEYNELGLIGLDDEDEDEEEDGNKMESARYEDFFGGKRTGQGKKPKVLSGSDDDGDNNQKKNNLSTHEKELEKLRSEIDAMEKANLEQKTWMMQGEVTATKRPKNSALEVDLEFEHNVRPAPVITEEVTASLEELIKKRILEGCFDDVQKPPSLPSKSPREKVELDENKSGKGLAALYEDEYVQKTGLVSTALSFKDEQKKEASLLFKKLCLKLDALSHFHFTPKPVIEDMSIQSNVPALAMEEIAPLAVSDAAMLAPEEVFAGKGVVKEETELTKADRKRRRSNKKRKFKAEATKRMARKVQQNLVTNSASGKEEL